ncbi:MAG TPA: 4Fe-4S dicluster domain-containing protein [Anaerovoracaceae bacterium]|nr:4Fe-4S dicluster domain-containing protein [Anaerovoracaceae bacterium]
MSSLVELIKNAGIVGAGGAGFPTHVKLDTRAEYVIVNGAECEPLLRVDQQLMEAYSKEMAAALDQVVWETGARKGIIAIKKKHHEVVRKLEAAIGGNGNLEIFLLDDFYPAGDEQVTVYEVLQRIVPEGGIPLEVKTVVVNAETLLNIYYALSGKSVTEKYVTVTGAVRRPVTLKAPVGTDVALLIEAAGGAAVSDFAIIDGGPMMGKILAGNRGYVKKTTKGLIVLPVDHPLIKAKNKTLDTMLRESRSACCQCILCTEVCPRNLLGHRLYPHKLMRLTQYNSLADNSSSMQEAFLCCECGLCEQACIMGLQPWKLNQALKVKMGAAGIKNPYHSQPERAAPFREYKKFPVKRLIQRLGLGKYDVSAPLDESIKVKIKEVTIDWKQHLGAPAEPAVTVNDRVRAGQIVGKIPEGKLGANVHSGIDGTVVSVTKAAVTITGGAL